jgi:hypothetical protein
MLNEVVYEFFIVSDFAIIIDDNIFRLIVLCLQIIFLAILSMLFF